METERMGKLIARLREERGWTQRELAGRLAVTDKAVSRWENGYGLPDVSLLPALAAALGITADELLAGELREERRGERAADGAGVVEDIARAVGEADKTPAAPAREGPVWGRCARWQSGPAAPAREGPARARRREQDPVAEALEDSRQGRFRLRLRQVTVNEFTLPQLLCCLAAFVLLLFHGCAAGRGVEEVYSYSILALATGRYDSIHASQTAELAVTLGSTAAALLGMALALVGAARAVTSPGEGMLAGTLLAALLTAGLFYSAGVGLAANRALGVERYFVPGSYWAAFGCACLNIVYANAVAMHRRPKKRLLRQTAAILLAGVVAATSSALVQGATLPRQLVLADPEPTIQVGGEYYGKDMGDQIYLGFFSLPVLTNRSPRKIAVRSLSLLNAAGGERSVSWAECVVVGRYRTMTGYAALVTVLDIPGGRAADEPFAPVRARLVLDVDGEPCSFSLAPEFSGESADLWRERAEQALDIRAVIPVKRF